MLPVTNKGFWFSPAYWVCLGAVVILCLALCSCAHVKWGNPGSSGYEGEIKPVFPSLTPAPCEKEGP